MLRYLQKRLLLLPIVIFGVTFIAFFITHVLPGDPARMALGEKVSKEALELMRNRMGLDKPIYIQYGLYLNQLFHGDLGRSVYTNQPVLDELLKRLPATLELVIFAMILAVLLGIPLGTISASKQNTWPDHISRVFSILFISIPSFWIGLLAIYFLFYKAKIFPAPIGRVSAFADPCYITGFHILDSLLMGDWKLFLDSLSHIFLPGFCLSLYSLGLGARVLRSSMLDVLNSDYVTTAFAKGLRRPVVVYKHALRNALLPMVTVLGLNFGHLLSGSVLIETIFTWQGMGMYAVDSITRLDYLPIQGFLLVNAFFYVLVNILVDVLYVIINPRIRYV
jgi:peptide/nickel transport system permease protein